MVLIFDLDDTLYDESAYVESGFRAVAGFGQRAFGWDPAKSFETMMAILHRNGRGAVFDSWLELHGAHRRDLVQRCVHTYRHHRPVLRLEHPVERMLRRLNERHRLFVVTDGHKVVQARKVEALGIERLVEKVYITHRYGLVHAKPSTYCFERIKERSRCAWSDMLHCADNPAKDFVNLKRLGVHTVRVLTGAHREVRSNDEYDARYKIPSLEHFEALLETLDR
jgi:putative hydrolase of the HAD superfamily